MPSTTKTTVSVLAALGLVLMGFATTAAAATDASTPEAEAASTTNCLQVYFEYEVGPATFTYNCGGDVDVDEDWEPGVSTETSDHLLGLSEELGCALKDADTVGEIFWCFFGPPGP